MKLYLLLGLLTGGGFMTHISSNQLEGIRTSKLTPAYLRDLRGQYGVDDRFVVIDDKVDKDEDEMGIEDGVTILHLIARTDADDVLNKQKLYDLALEVVDERPEFINDQQSEGFTPYHNAAFRNYTKMLELFESRGADKDIVDNTFKRNAHQWQQVGRESRK